jgi:hypothetical protein
MSDESITIFANRNNTRNADLALSKLKQSRKGTPYVVLTDKEHPNTKFEVETKKFNSHPRRYANRERVGNGVWE